jgi:hypothetical protein
MYILNDLATAAQNEKLRAASRTALHGGAYAAGHAGNRSGSGRRLAGLRIPRVLRARRAAHAH